jgi:multidrug efflux system membrane fusion protein
VKTAYYQLMRPNLGIVLALGLAATLTACHKAEPVAVAPRSVVVLPALADTQGQTLSLPAEAQARFVTPMSFRVAGQVIDRRVHLGDTVRKGQIVASLDPADAERNATSTQADLAAARQRLDSAQKQLQRDTAQAQEELISALQLEQTQDAYAAALSQARDAEQRAGVAANQRGYNDLLAEHDGLISAEQANTGEVLSAGQPVYSLAWSGAIDVTTDVAERQIGAIRPGATATIGLAALPGRVLHGTVREVSPVADPKSRTYHVKITLDTQDPALRLGMTGNVSIDTGSAGGARTATVLIPATALFHQGDRPAVWVVRPDGHLELRPVVVSAYGERSVTLSNGIASGENIVVQGVHTLTAGETVKAIAPMHAGDFAL